MAPLGLFPRWRPRFRHHVGAVDEALREVNRPALVWVLGERFENFAQNPALTQRLNRLQQVDPEGKRSGKEAHAAPVCSTLKNAIAHHSVIVLDRSAAPVGLALPRWNQRRRYCPLFVC
jgi:hypothetical protein